MEPRNDPSAKKLPPVAATDEALPPTPNMKPDAPTDAPNLNGSPDATLPSSRGHLKTTDQENVVPNDVDIMDVSPAANQDQIVAADENKENKVDPHADQTPLLAPVSNPKQQQQLPEAVTPALPPNTSQQQQTSQTPLEDEARDTQFAYVLRKYNSIVENRVYSPWHTFGGYKWRLLIFPRGNHTSNHDLSVYLECGGPYIREEQNQKSAANQSISPNGKETAIPVTPPTNWSRHAKFSLHLVHPSSPVARAAIDSDESLTDPSRVEPLITDSNTSARIQSGARGDVVKETAHTFRQNVSDWGFLEFAPFSSLQPNSYADEELNVVIMVKIRLQEQSVDNTFTNSTPWDSRKETGLVGFKNQGATCYMNSLLQTLYMLSAFRKAVYNMPLPEEGNDNSGSELSYALQKVFYELQFSPSVVKTKKLTESFGWDTTDAFTQHDVQELKLILCDELAEKMKKIKPNEPNSLSTLFQGKLLNYIECVNVPYKSTREEEFSDLSLNVKGCQNIYDSFEKYVEVEMMDGDNKYRADGYEKLQDARKGVKFLQLPPVLQLHLKRFEYDTTRDAMVKINDRYEFQTEIDLSRFVEGSKGDDIYVLHSVLVHIGDVNGGHYHAFIRPEIDTSDVENKKQSQWYKFDDETVTRAYEEAAVQDNYGVGGERDFKRGIDDDLGNGGLNGTNPPSVFPNRGRNYQPRRYSNAYMLQYLRKSDVHFLLTLPKNEDVPEALAGRIKKEREEEEQRKRDNTEQHLYMNAIIATNEDMVQHHETDLVNWIKVRPLRVKRATQLGELKFVLQKESFIQDARRVRLWKFDGRRNHTIRPDTLVADGDDSQPIEPNGRDPLTAGLNVPMYPTRHGYYGQDEGARFYAEDMSSKYCLAGGTEYSAFVEANGEDELQDKSVSRNKLEPELGLEHSSRPLPLKSGRETLVFLKYYMSKPHVKLQWVGHAVVDRKSTVGELEPLLRKAVESFRNIHGDDSIAPLSLDSKIRVFEEVFPTQIKELNLQLTLEDHQIPCDGGNGDIIVFQEDVPALSGLRSEDTVDEADVLKESEWDGFQEVSRGDGTDAPLGGRPLPSVLMYYDYLAYRVKIEFKDRQNAGELDDGLSIFFEMSKKDTYRTARKVLSRELGDDVDPDYIRFFAHDYRREAPELDSFRLNDNAPLERLPVDGIVSTGQPDYRTIWYEKTEYPISEFNRKREVRVVWRPDGGTRSTSFSPRKVGSKANVEMKEPMDGLDGTDMSVDGGEDKNDRENGDVDGDESLSGSRGSSGATERGAKAFSVLVPNPAKYTDVMDQVRIKRGIPSDVEIRMFKVLNSRILEFVEGGELVPQLLGGGPEYDCELRAEPVPADETIEARGSEYEMMSVVHLSKQREGRGWRAPLFGQPFLVKVRKNGEPVEAIRQRIQEKMGVPSEEFEDWALAEMAQMKPVYLEKGTLYQPRGVMAMEYCSLAIEHKNTTPARRTTSSVSRYADKPLKIRS